MQFVRAWLAKADEDILAAGAILDVAMPSYDPVGFHAQQAAEKALNGQVLRIALSDVPERKADLVSGRYELAAAPGPRTVAVKVVDMLGEEVLLTHRID